MKKIIFLVFMTIASLSYGQQCDCSSNLKWLIETFEKNDAGFQYVIDKKGENAYLAHNKIFKEKASKIQNKEECLKLLNDWTEFFRKNHLEVVLNAKSNSSNNQKELSEKEIYNLYKDAPKFKITEKEFEEYISKLENKNSFEGMWIMGPYKIGIIKDNKNTKRDFFGFILKSNYQYWQPNQIKLEIVKEKDNKYTMKYFMGDHTLKIINNIKLIEGTHIKAGFISLIKIDDSAEAEKFYKYISSSKPFIEKISDNTVLLRIPSFGLNNKKEIDSLLEINNELISKTENLIIDLRDNGGGSDISYKKIIPYLYTNPMRHIGVQFLSTKLNNKRMVEFMKDPNRGGKDYKKAVKKSLEKLNKHIGEFVSLNENIVRINTLDTILPYPKKVGILINDNCASTTEQFLLAAKQSKKVKLFGTTTMGVLDISNMYSVISPSGEFILWYSLTKSFRIPEMAIDDKGIQPDFYFDRTIKPYEWIKETEEILNSK